MTRSLVWRALASSALLCAGAGPLAADPQRSAIDPFDLNGDGRIDAYDLDILIFNLGEHDGVLPGDFDEDGDIDRADFERALPVFARHFDLNHKDVAQKLVGVTFSDDEPLPMHGSTASHIKNFSAPHPDHLTIISFTWEPGSHPDDPHKANFSSHGPIPGHVWSISKEWHPGNHSGISSWWDPDKNWPPGHKNEMSKIWKPNHVVKISLEWNDPPRHWTSTSEEEPRPEHTTSLSASWPPSHEYGYSLGWTPHNGWSSNFVPHNGLVSRYWPPSHIKSYSDEGILTPPKPEEHDSDTSWLMESGLVPGWPFGHMYQISTSWPENHKQQISVYFPPNHVYQVTAQWPNPFLWPPNHTLSMTNGWIEPGTPPGHDSLFSTIHNKWWSTVAPPTHTIITSLGDIPLPLPGTGGASK